MANLLTHHDPYHIHAICGLSALLHFFYRLYLNAYDVTDSGFGQLLQADVLSMIILLLPNVTSFVFTFVPARKKGLDGFTIWKEYRWHAFIWALRYWFYLWLEIFDRHMGGNFLSDYGMYVRAAVEFAGMYANQYVTALYPEQKSTIRGMYSSPLFVMVVGYAQFAGRAGAVYGPPDSRDTIAMYLWGLFIVQLNAFNMTLRKKRKIGPRITQAVYSSLLGIGFFQLVARRFWEQPLTGIFDPRLKIYHTGALAYYLRRQGLDRFTTWFLTLFIVETLTQQFQLFEDSLTST